MGCRPLVQHARTIRHRARTAQNVWSPVYVDAMVLRDRDADLDDLTGDFGQADSGLEERLYVQTDANFNVTSLLDTAGAVVERFLYDPYGTFTVHDANWTLDAGGSDFGWVHLHQGGRYDATTGLYHFRFRDYDPELGRWTRQDPAGYVDGANLYVAYAANPLNHFDPQGLTVMCLPHRDMCGGGGGGGLGVPLAIGIIILVEILTGGSAGPITPPAVAPPAPPPVPPLGPTTPPPGGQVPPLSGGPRPVPVDPLGDPLPYPGPVAIPKDKALPRTLVDRERGTWRERCRAECWEAHERSFRLCQRMNPGDDPDARRSRRLCYDQIAEERTRCLQACG